MCEYRGGKPPCVMKVTVVGILHYPPATIVREKGLSVSIHVGTRKVRNILTVILCNVILLPNHQLTSYLSSSLLFNKDGELCLGRVKPGETLVEARRGSDVQIDLQI